MDGRTVAQPSAPTVYVKQDAVGAWIIIDIQLYGPASRLVNVDVRENIHNLVCFCWTVGWWEVFIRVGRTARSAIGRSECR